MSAARCSPACGAVPPVLQCCGQSWQGAGQEDATGCCMLTAAAVPGQACILTMLTRLLASTQLKQAWQAGRQSGGRRRSGVLAPAPDAAPLCWAIGCAAEPLDALFGRALSGLISAHEASGEELSGDFAAILTPYSGQLRLINSLLRRVQGADQARQPLAAAMQPGHAQADAARQCSGGT